MWNIMNVGLGPVSRKLTTANYGKIVMHCIQSV